VTVSHAFGYISDTENSQLVSSFYGRWISWLVVWLFGRLVGSMVLLVRTG